MADPNLQKNPNKNKIVIVVGDSWSTLQFQSSYFPDVVDNFPIEQSLPARLKQLGNCVVHTSAASNSTGDQLTHLERILKHNSKDLDRISAVVMGWTEWCRDIETFDCSYSQQQSIISHNIKERINNISNQIPNAKWLHWGGLSKPWAVPSSSMHLVLYESYSQSRVNSPVLNTNLLTIAPRTHRPGDIKEFLLQKFPGTDPKQIKNIIHQILDTYRWIAANEKYFPDGAHLAHEYYDQLAQTIHDNINPAVERSNIANSTPK